MSYKLQKKDFIEIEFTGRIKDGEVFDSNIQSELDKLHAGHDHGPENHEMPKARSFIFSLGQDMFLKGIDDFLIGKDLELNKDIQIELGPEKAFGKRDLGLVQLMPLSVFKKQNLNPIPGITFNFDGRVAKILSASGGRIRVDFNNPLSGKAVVYDIKILRKIDDLEEKIKYFLEFLFRRDINFKLDEQSKKIVLEVDKQIFEFAKMFNDNFKDLFGMDLEVKELKEEKKEASEENKK